MISSLHLARFGLLVVLVAAALFTAPTVHAQAEFKRKEIEATIRQQEKPTEPRTLIRAMPSGPALTVDNFVGSTRHKRYGYPEQESAYGRYLPALIKRASDDDPEKPDYLFRLGELYADKRRYLNYEAHGVDQKILEAQRASNSEQVGRLTLKKQRLEESSADMAGKALELYVGASKYPRYGRMDEVLVRLIYFLHDTNKDAQAREFFDRLIADYPQSKYVPNAYLSSAERHFQNGEMESARKYYEKVTTFADSSVFGFALYKMGWVEIKLGHFETAIAIFAKVIRHCQDGKIPKNQAGPLGKEAKKGLVEAYARTRGNSPAKAWAFFQRIGGDYAPKMLESLAEIAWEEGLAPKSLELYRKLVALDEDSQRVCSWQTRILRNSLSVGSRKDQVAELQRLGKFYETASHRKDIQENALTECRNVLHDTGKALALTVHMEAKRRKDPDDYRLAGMVHKEFLSHFKSRSDTSHIAFNYGELLWQMGAWPEAAWTFSKLARLDPEGRYGTDAASIAVIAWKKALNIDD